MICRKKLDSTEFGRKKKNFFGSKIRDFRPPHRRFRLLTAQSVWQSERFHLASCDCASCAADHGGPRRCVREKGNKSYRNRRFLPDAARVNAAISSTA